VNSVSFSPDGRTLTSGSEGHAVRLWDVVTDHEKAVLAGHSERVTSVGVSPDGRILASGSYDMTIRLWDAATHQEKAVLAGHKSEVTSVSFSPDGRTLASGSRDETVRLWDLATGQEKAVLAGHKNAITSVSFSPDGRTLASGSWDKTVRLWDTATGQEKAVLTGHTGWIVSVSFSPDGRTLASGASENTVRLWDAATGQEKAVLEGNAEGVYSVSFSPDGRTLISGGGDKTIRLLDLSFLHDPRPSEEQLKAAERQYKLRLVNLELQPIPPERHLYRTRPPVPTWSESHPLHWLPAAERGDRQAMLQLGILYDRAHDLPLAETWYRQAAEAGDAEAQTQLADVRRRQVAALWKALPEGRITPSQFDQVLDLCNRVIALDPKDVEAYGRRAQILYLRNETRQAEADLRKVIDLAPEFEGAQGTLGWILITQGRFDEALPFATKAHTLAPDRSDWAINLGHVHLLTSDRQTARQYYEKTIPLIPDEAALKSGPLADLDLFIKKGWQVKACREEAAWLRKRFAEIHAKPH
jgi:tetratricopeptide (TPR) repeat protein